MSETILGQYNHRNYTELNPCVEHILGFECTTVHEFAHLSLVRSTSYGLLLSILSQNGLFLESATLLQKAMLHVQEAVAVFIEYSFFLKVQGVDKFKEAKKNILSRSSYFKYIKDIQFLWDEFEDVEIDEKMRLVYWMGLLSLSIDIERIPVELYSQPRKLEKYISDNRYIDQINPTHRFKELRRAFKRIIDNGDEIDFYSALDQNLFEEAFIEVHPYNQDVFKSYLSELCGDNITQEILSKITRASDKDFHLRTKIVPFNMFEEELVVAHKFEWILKQDVGVLFIHPFEIIGQKDPIYGISFFNLKDKKNYFIKPETKRYVASLIRLTKNRENIITAVLPQGFDIGERTIKGLNRGKSGSKLFIYRDIPYIDLNKDKINMLFGEKAKCRILSYDNFICMVTKTNLDEDVYVAHILSNEARSEIQSDIELNILKVELVDGKIGKYDSIVFKNEQDIYEIDILVNATLQYGGKKPFSAYLKQLKEQVKQ
ncbi:hypothetical protein D3C75_453660 [compost metagenome]